MKSKFKLAAISLLCALFLAVFPQMAFSYEKMIKEHCAREKIPANIVLAIAKQESAMNPLCINVEGKDFTPETREEAEKIIRTAQAKDQSYDVGLLQINSQWIKKWNIDPVSLLEPEANIRAGLRILKKEIDRHGMNWRAVGAYHSPDPLRSRYYASQVYSRMKGKNPLGLSPRLQMLINRGIITEAEARTMFANPRLYGQKNRKRIRALEMAKHRQMDGNLDKYMKSRKKSNK